MGLVFVAQRVTGDGRGSSLTTVLKNFAIGDISGRLDSMDLALEIALVTASFSVLGAVLTFILSKRAERRDTLQKRSCTTIPN